MKGVTILNVKDQDTDFDQFRLRNIHACVVRRQYLGISKIGFRNGAGSGGCTNIEKFKYMF